MLTPIQNLNLLSRFDRTFNLKAAILEAVDPGNRVLDAGCGSGLLSLWAAQVGAKEIVAILRRFPSRLKVQALSMESSGFRNFGIIIYCCFPTNQSAGWQSAGLQSRGSR